METKPPKGFETSTHSIDHVTIIGRELPNALDSYDSLSEVRNITVYSAADSLIRKGSATTTVSEKELFDDLLDFCGRCRDLPTEESDRAYGYDSAINGIDDFLTSMTYVSKELYAEAVHGLAGRHERWLADNPQKSLLFVIPNSRSLKSQAKVTTDIASSVSSETRERVHVVMTGDLSNEMIGPDTKIVLSDDWSVSGNHVANDLGNLFQRLDAQGIDAHKLTVEVNLLVARSDQVKKGIGAVDRLKEYFPEYMTKEPTLISYFEAPVNHGMTTPTGSHSSADYGFATNLDSMLTIAQRHGVADRMPYIGVIIPEYSYEYKHIDK